MNQKDFFNVDWTKIPEPKLDVNLNHLNNFKISDIELNSTDNKIVNISKLKEITVIYIYPMTGVPGKALPEGWDEIPGARGCTPQSCTFRDNFSKLKELGVKNIFGLSTQNTEYQKELADRLHLPYPILSDIACADIDQKAADKCAKLYNIKSKTVSEILKDNEIEVILNLTIPQSHYSVSKKVLNSGKHVYSEKPLATYFAKGKELVSLAKKNKLYLGNAPDTFLGGGIQKARELIDSDLIGSHGIKKKEVQ